MTDISFSDSLNRLREPFLWAAAQGGNTEDCESLLEIGAEVDWTNTDGDTALLAACRRGHADTIVLLLVYGASPNIRGRDLLTPLHICARNGDSRTLNVLLDAGADASLKTPDNETALSIAEQKGHENIVRRLSGDPAAQSVREPSPPMVRPQRNSSHSHTIQPNSVNVSAQGRLRPGCRGNIPKLKEGSSLSIVPELAEPRGKLIHHRGISTNIPDSKLSNVDDRDVGSKRVPSQALNTGGRSQSSSSYSLIGKDVDHEFSKDEQYVALCKQLDAENRSKKALELQVDSLRKQLKELDISISRLHHQMAETDEKLNVQNTELNKLRGIGVDTYTMQECEDIERKLKCTIDLIAARKDKIVKEEMGQQKEQRLCVICQIEEKSVVLFPCRHMCLCETCANHDELDACPLCRRVIVQKVCVFS